LSFDFGSIHFDRPLLLLLGALVPIGIVLLLLIAHRKRKARLAKLGSPEMVTRLIPPNAVRPPGWRAVRLGLAGACVAVALAGPRWGMERTIVRGSGVDIVLALDASLSMMATDERPNRLERMKQEVRRLRSLSGGDRVALLAFAGRSYILTPLTVDDGALDLFLDNLDPSVVGQAGSSLARAIRQGTDLLLSTRSGSDRAIVVMSDGEAFETEESVAEEAKRAAQNGIMLVTVGFGTPAGSSIPVVGENGTVSQKRDENGQVVISRYHPELLRAAATAAQGTFIDAAETDKASRIRNALRALRAQPRITDIGQERTPRFQLFLVPAFLLLLADTLLVERRGRRRSRAAAAAATAAALLLLVVPRPARAGDVEDGVAAYKARHYAEAVAYFRRALERGDRSPATLYNLGTAMLASDSLASAAEALERASLSRDPDVRFRSLFNLGLAHLRRGLAAKAARQPEADEALDAALAAYKKALLLRSADQDAKWNYELALRERKGGGGGGGGGGGESESPQQNEQSQQQAPRPRPAGGIGERQADQLLQSAAREERDVQQKKQRQNRTEPPSVGKDW
jgi:Ca-activated chloride channel homolog